MSKPQNVNALDDSVSDDGQETYHLFTLDTHSVRSVSVQTGKKFFAAIKLLAAKNFFAWKTLQLDTASTTNTPAVDDLRKMCPARFDIHGLIKPCSTILRTYGGGVIKPVGQVELVCETQGKFHTLQFQLLNKDVMGSQSPLLSGSDCVRLGLIEIGRNTCSFDRNNPKGGASEVCQLDSRPQRGRVEESGTPDQEISHASLDGSVTEELNLTEGTTSTSPVHGTFEDISVVHSAVARDEKVCPKGNMASEVGVSHVPVPLGKLTKAIVIKDVRTGLGTLGPVLHSSMNPNVTPTQAHPHGCPEAKEAKASNAIQFQIPYISSLYGIIERKTTRIQSGCRSKQDFTKIPNKMDNSLTLVGELINGFLHVTFHVILFLFLFCFVFLFLFCFVVFRPLF